MISLPCLLESMSHFGRQVDGKAGFGAPDVSIAEL